MEVKGLNEAGIPPAEQAQLKRRFANIADYANEARLLWVDDKHPQQNVRERRVLSALSIHIDLANSTDDALKWLCQGDYDILITNLTRPNDGAAPCTDSPDAAQRAGCYLIKQVAQLEQLKKTKTPKIIIYAIKTEGVVHSTKNVSVTNTAGDFFNALIAAIERMGDQK
jgi:hypothetical protein